MDCMLSLLSWVPWVWEHVSWPRNIAASALVWDGERFVTPSALDGLVFGLTFAAIFISSHSLVGILPGPGSNPCAHVMFL